MTEDQRILAMTALVAGAAGALSPLPIGAGIRAGLLLIFLLTGVGSAALCWPTLPRGVAVSGVLGLSLGAVVLVTTSMAWLRWWYPTAATLTLATAVAVAGALRLRTGRRSGRHAARERHQ